MRAFLKAVGIPLSVIPSIALPLILAASAGERGAGEQEYRSLPALPASAEAADAGALDALAVELADHLRAVPVDATGDQFCPAADLRVSYAAPGDGARHGAHLDPLGPEPTAATQAVNGVVVCAGSDYGFMGFEAWRDGTEWRIAAVPFVSELDETPGAVAEPPHAEPAPLPAPPLPAPAVPALDTLQGGPIEGYARYEPQRICDPAAKPGTLALRNLLLARNPGTRSLGISRNCGAGGTSEHKEGRALDWGVLATRPHEAAAAERFIGQLMATDAEGHRHALARRMGVMYVIWNRRIWSAYRPEQGWRAYSGPSPHTDHVHVSLSWAGATGRTSFWSGKVDPAALLAAAPAAATGSGGGSASKRHVARLTTEPLRAELRGRSTRGAIDPATGTLDPARLPADWRARWDQMTPEQQAEVRRRMEERARHRHGGGHRDERHDEPSDDTGESPADARQSRADEPQGPHRESRAERRQEPHRESRAEERAAREQARAQRHAEREAERQAEQQRREAARAADEEAHREAAAAQRAEHEVQRPERQRGDGEHGRERAEARQREQAERQAQRQAAREAEQRRRAEARQQRHAEGREQAPVQQGDGGRERRGGHGRGRGEGRGGHHRSD